MPKLSQRTSPATTPSVEFVLSVPLDLMNALFFTSLVPHIEGIDDWPAQVRKEMAPDLLTELDLLGTFPNGDPGILGSLSDHLFLHPEAWADIDSLIRFVSSLPLGVGESPVSTGIQGLALYAAACLYGDGKSTARPGEDPRRTLAEALNREGADVDAHLALFDRPEELRGRMVRLIQRFYEEHYRHDLPRRLPCLERSVAAHRGKPVEDIAALARTLSHRNTSCIEDVCLGPYSKYIFMPSLDLGPYLSCADLSPVHALVYPCEPEFAGEQPGEAEEMRRLARIHKALADEQRLRMLRLLRGGEMYAQEIVESTGLHQSVVSRHLSFLRAVGLVTSRRQNNMKFFSLNPEVWEDLAATLALFSPESTAGQ